MVSDLGASAAYAIACQTSEVVAKNQAARLGCIGIASMFHISENQVDITSTKVPKKRPDVRTVQGVAAVK